MFVLQATGNKVGTVMEGIATATSALTIAFVYSWKLTLVTLAFMPLMVISSIIQVRTVTGFSRGDKEITEKAGKVELPILITILLSHRNNVA